MLLEMGKKEKKRSINKIAVAIIFIAIVVVLLF